MTYRSSKLDPDAIGTDDVLQDYLDELVGRHKLSHSVDHELMAVFALLYLADKLDSIDTRLLHLVHTLEKRETRDD